MSGHPPRSSGSGSEPNGPATGWGDRAHRVGRRGLIGALSLTRVMGAILFNVSPTDPATYAGVTVLLLAIGLLASYLPARRAAMVDPVEALRAD